MSAIKRAALLKAGEELFSRSGYREISIAEITRACGMGTGSFYHYFPDKVTFYEVILDEIEKRAIQDVDRIISRLQSPLNRLKVLYRFMTLGIPRSPLLLGVLTGDRRYTFPGRQERVRSRGDGDGRSSLRGYIEKTLAELLREGAQKRVFRTDLFNNPGTMLMAIFDAILLRLASPDIDDLMDDLLLLIERGLPRRVRLRKRDERVDRQLIKDKKSRMISLRPRPE